MPQVPYQPYPTVDPSSPGEKISVNTPGAAFGENIGAALQHLGATGEQVGNELFQRAIALQDLANETAARKAASDYVQQQGLKQADFDSLKGKAAKDGLLPHIQDSEALRQSQRSSLASPMAQRMFDDYTFNFKDRIVFSSARHAGDEFKTYSTNEALASADQAAHTWINPSDPRERAQKISEQNDALDTVAPLQGWGPEKLADEKFKANSKVIAGQANALARNGMTDQALQVLEDAKDQGTIEDDAYTASKSHVEDRQVAITSKNEGNKIFGFDKPLKQMETEAEAAAKVAAKGNPDLETRYYNGLMSQIRVRLAYDKREVETEKQGNINTIYGGINSGKLRSLQDVQNDPDAGPAYAALSEQDKAKIPKQIETAVTNANLQQHKQSYDYLQRLAATDPHTFLQQDLFDSSLKLNSKDVDHFLAKRQQLMKTPLEDPHVQRAIGWMRNSTFAPTLKELGVYYAPTRNETNADYDGYVSHMEEGIQTFMEQNHRPPSQPEFMEKIAPQLLHPSQEHRFGEWLLGPRQVREFQKQVPPEVLEGAKKELEADATKQGIEPPSDDEIHRYILHSQWKQFWQGKGGESGGPAAAGPE